MNTKIKVTIETIEAPIGENKYPNTTEIYQQTMAYDWMLDNNPYMIQKIIAEVNTIKVKNDS